MKNEKDIGQQIKNLRGNTSLRDFAKKCDISHTTIDNLEKGVDFRTGKPVQAKIATLQKIADACGVPLSYIIGEEDQSTNADELKIALFGTSTQVTDEMWNRITDYAKLIKAQHKQDEKEEVSSKSIEVAARLRFAMMKAGTRTYTLSNHTNISPYQIADYLDGVLLPSNEHFAILADKLNISKDWLMCRDNTISLKDALYPNAKKNFNYEEWLDALEFTASLNKNISSSYRAARSTDYPTNDLESTNEENEDDTFTPV